MGLGFRIKAQHWSCSVVSLVWFCPCKQHSPRCSSRVRVCRGHSQQTVWNWPISGDKSSVVHMKAMLCQLVLVPKNSSWPAFFASRDMRLLTSVIPAVFCVKPEPLALAGVKQWEVRLKIWAFYWLSRISAEIFAQRKIQLHWLVLSEFMGEIDYYE